MDFTDYSAINNNSDSKCLKNNSLSINSSSIRKDNILEYSMTDKNDITNENIDKTIKMNNNNNLLSFHSVASYNYLEP